MNEVEGSFSPYLSMCSWVCGVLYTILFSLGMFIQCLVNNKNKSTEGYSTDYAIIAFAGFFFLMFNQTLGFVFPFSNSGRVHLMDLIFAILMVEIRRFL